MGTNTDPYQRAEGKYRLTRGIVEVLAERRNPFSILTKSTLAIRDLDLFIEAAERTDVSVDFSIATLDEGVWRETEPGTPHPRQRMAAVKRLNEAGVPSGVLIAPLLPHISDGEDQVAEVMAAAEDAGARFATPMLLHLSPPMKSHWMEWLRTHRPELTADYRELYRNRSDSSRCTSADTIGSTARRAGGLPHLRSTGALRPLIRTFVGPFILASAIPC